MSAGSRRKIGGLVAALVAAAGLVLLGRVTAYPPASSSALASAGVTQGDYLEGLRVGQAQGVREGRALQEGAALPVDARQAVQQAFTAGYDAGANDVFLGYDGGWAVSAPYLITLGPGGGPIVYRIRTRIPLQPGVDYVLCPDRRDICEQTR